MNKEIKFDTQEDILYQIAMIIYDKHNSNIASINDHLGEMYSYKDLEDAKRYELEDEKHLLELAVKQLQEENQQLKEQLKQRDEVIDKAIKFINEHVFIDESMTNCNALSQKNVKELLNILKGVDD